MFAWSSDGGFQSGGYNGNLDRAPASMDSGGQTSARPMASGYDPMSNIYGAAIGALGNYFAQREANETNREIADNATRANMAEAQRNRDFQEQMSNSAFQRQMEDLKKSGLNPLLMSGMSGASTPTGSTGNAETATMENELGGALATAKDALQLGIQMKRTGAEIGLMEDQRNLTKAQTGKAAMETQVMSKGIPEADIKNSVYNWVKGKFSEMKQSTSLPATQPKEVMDFHKKYQQLNRRLP